MAKKKVWKYAKEKEIKTGKFVKLIDNEPKELIISDWDFSKAPAGYGFKAYVTSEDGQDKDKIWIVWDYDLMLLLKKRLTGKKPYNPQKLKVLVKKPEKDSDKSFEVELIKAS